MLHDQNNGIPCVCHITRTDCSFIKMVKLLTLSSSPFQMQTLTPDALTCTCSLATWSCMRAFNGETTKTKLPRIFYICPSACTKSKLVGKNIDKSEIYHTQWLILPKCQFHGQLYFSASKLNSYCLYHLLLYLFQTILQHTLKEHHLVSHFVSAIQACAKKLEVRDFRNAKSDCPRAFTFVEPGYEIDTGNRCTSLHVTYNHQHCTHVQALSCFPCHLVIFCCPKIVGKCPSWWWFTWTRKCYCLPSDFLPPRGVG